MFDTSEARIRVNVPKKVSDKQIVLYTDSYNDLVGLDFSNLQFIKLHLCNREWRGTLRNGESIIIVISLNIVQVGVGDSETDAILKLKPIAALNDIYADVYDVGKLLHWQIPICCAEQHDYL